MRSLLSCLPCLVLALACNGSGPPAKAGTPASPSEPAGSAAKASATPQTPAAALVAHLLQTEHLRRLELDDEVSREAFASYLDMLDPSKAFLLQSDVDRLSRHAAEMDDQMESGRLELAREAAQIMDGRLTVVRKLVEGILSKPLDLSDDERFETDPEKRSFCTTEAELAERWRKQLEFEILSRLARMDEMAEARAKLAEGHADALEEIPDTAEGREAKARADMATAYDARFARLMQTEPIDQAQVFLNAVAGIYDPHTMYLAPISKENFDIQMSGSLEGIGALLREDDHYIEVQEIVPGSASWRQGELEAGDTILAVAEGNGKPVDVVDMRINDVVKRIRGKKGTVVTLTVKKPDDTIKVISITRDVVEVEATYAKGGVLEHPAVSGPVGYIYVPSFYGNTRSQRGATPERNSAGDVRVLLDRFSEQGLGAVILDLRGNGGGLLDDARVMAGLFIEEGPIVQIQDAAGRGQALSDDDPAVAFRGDVIVLVDRFSASASEIVAAALQDYGRALVVGTSATHGKGTVQMLVDLDQLARHGAVESDEGMGVLKLTRQQFFRVTGASTQLRGVVPDVLLPDPTAYIESGERSLDHAIPWSQVDALPFERWPAQRWDPATLTQRSQARQAQNQTFARIAKRVALIEARRDDTVVPLARATWQAERKRDKAALEALDEPDEQPALFQVDVVDYDGASTVGVRPNPHSRAKPGADADPKAASDERWSDSVSRDPWLAEALLILRDMRAPAAAAR
ncbi:carboxy terminal-processing peptidase [Haliangium sp.]|uniref:carboxy terminal-processing peptidase n=1 Tax=Haliangium sp. TaxID=2663208 RepID=UPI003D0A0B83